MINKCALEVIKNNLFGTKMEEKQIMTNKIKNILKTNTFINKII